ncbi:hypothetical protein ACVI1N_000171 [Sinorhizobium medicae]
MTSTHDRPILQNLTHTTAIGPKHGETGLVLVGERGQGSLFHSQ